MKKAGSMMTTAHRGIHAKIFRQKQHGRATPLLMLQGSTCRRVEGAAFLVLQCEREHVKNCAAELLQVEATYELA